MRSYITIDGGTTNTRVNLVKNRCIAKSVKISAGARVGMDNKSFLAEEIKKAVAKLSEGEKAEKILASGMITSEFGLYDLPHISAPAGIAELHNSMKEVLIPVISDIPFVFIPGVKINGERLDNTDMMRGEETELMGLIDNDFADGIYVLPGSHSKIIKVNSDGKIVNFSTMLTGEMIAALSGGTILKDAVDLNQSETDDDFLFKGYNYCTSFGINEALFKTRVLKNIFGATEKEVYSFFEGAVLQAEIKKIIETSEQNIIVGGKTQIKKAMCKLLENCSGKQVLAVEESRADFATALGAIKIYEYPCDN